VSSTPRTAPNDVNLQPPSYRYDVTKSSNIPPQLRSARQWLSWNYARDEKGKWTKPPIGKSNDPSTWTDFQTAVDAADEFKGGNCDGIGFSLYGTLFGGVDFDGVLDENGKAEPYVLAILKLLGNPYTEITPSGRGLRCYFECAKLPDGLRKFSAGGYGAEIYIGNEPARFFTVTGNRFSGNGIPKIDDISIPFFLVSQFKVNKNNTREQFEKFKRLWTGDASDYDGDDSTRDLALLGALSRRLNTKDRGTLVRYFNASVPGHREKWLSTKLHGKYTYQDLTLNKLLGDSQQPKSSAANLPGNPPSQKSNLRERKAEGEAIFRMGDVVVPKRIKWMWPNRVPSGKITLFAGNPDNAKSLVSSWLVATCTVGRPFPDAPNPLPPSEVLMLLGEDDIEDTAITRLMAAGADISKVHFMEAVRPPEDDERDIRLDWDLVRIEQRLKEHPNIRLIIIDPISNYLGEVSMVAEQDVRSVLIPLKRLAAKYTVAVITIMHLNKKADLEAICRVGGAMAFIGVARCSWLFVRDEDENEDGAQKNSDTFSMLRIKNNLARAEKNGLSYEVLVEKVTTSDGDELVPYIHWLGVAVKKTANEVLGGGRKERGRPKQQNSTLDDARRWLQDQLRAGQPHHGKDLLDAAKNAAGIKNSKLRDAAKSLNVVIYKDDQKDGRWLWRMPPVQATSATIAEGRLPKASEPKPVAQPNLLEVA
jgi:putative DNA primase/helicase